ncbi:hypothetical protein [Mycolicibacterium sp. P9-64]|uniref:hypothetical protein n=1 Tax=Mycolicibacterium sp. P9-64 TaxID=2024612 RepID=UPI0011ECBFD5|nr:hypothetical protein [Mycolicibacterium sp. P9-64]
MLVVAQQRHSGVFIEDRFVDHRGRHEPLARRPDVGHLVDVEVDVVAELDPEELVAFAPS